MWIPSNRTANGSATKPQEPSFFSREINSWFDCSLNKLASSPPDCIGDLPMIRSQWWLAGGVYWYSSTTDRDIPGSRWRTGSDPLREARVILRRTAEAFSDWGDPARGSWSTLLIIDNKINHLVSSALHRRYVRSERRTWQVCVKNKHEGI